MTETCNHEIVDSYADGGMECTLCGKLLAGVMLRHLGLEPRLVEEVEVDE